MKPRAIFFPLCVIFILAGCSRPDAPAVAQDLRLTRLGQAVFVLGGTGKCGTHAGFLLTGKGVVVVDPGPNRKSGELLATKIASLTTEPVVAVFNTHRHAEQWLGNQALKTTWPKAVIYAHPRTVVAARKEGENRLGRPARAATEAGSAVVPTEIAVEDADTLKVGSWHFRVHALAPAHTDSDIAVEVVEAGAIFVGDAVHNGCLGPMDEASFAGGIAATERLLGLGAGIWIPGHGPAGGRELVQTWHDYLATVTAQVKTLRDQGRTEAELQPAILERLSPWRGWQDFDSQAPRHIGLAFREAGGF